MKMQALVALKNMDYAKRKIKAGETFDASPRDTRILVALRRAQIDPAPGVQLSEEEIAAIDREFEAGRNEAAPKKELPIKEVVMEALGVYPDAPVRPKRSYTRRTTNYTTEG